MPQANSENSTVMPVDPTRRSFLSTAASAAAGGTVLALAAIPLASSATAPVSPLDNPVHPDATLLELEEKIFKHKEAFDDLGPETDRSNIWSKEWRLAGEFEKTQAWPTYEERRAIIDAIPEFKECMRLRNLQERQREAADDLVDQMWKITAQTPEGRRSKLIVLLEYVMEDDEWRRAFQGSFDVTRARDLMIEFVGGGPAEQLRDQFALEPETGHQFA